MDSENLKFTTFQLETLFLSMHLHMLGIHEWSVCKLRSEFICCFSFKGHVSSLQRILHKMGGEWVFF